MVWSSYTEDQQPNPEEKLIRKDEQSHLFKLLMERINELPNRQKELITLKFYEGLTYQEIVQRTGLSHRTVYNNSALLIKFGGVLEFCATKNSLL